MNNTFARLAILIGILIAANFLTSQPVLAETGRHSEEIKGADCSMCHRIQTSGKPVKAKRITFCNSCHNGDSIYTGLAEVPECNYKDVPLKEGSNSLTGFRNVENLDCNGCHNPHGNENYRMLRGKPGKISPLGRLKNLNATSINVPQVSGPGGNITRDNIDTWCAGCHEGYSIDNSKGHFVPAKDMVLFRHSTRLPGSCLACHETHSRKMDAGKIDGAALDGGTNAGSRISQNYSVACLKCHPTSALTKN